ncbi:MULTISPECIES: ABC transporter ATP-binding protein/permease [unclassified Breznakia]|uniref:ABC transporter ATP-binding protein/permease n=1 Tax=unclassified Breznakia TaxID=2623764 RepID=UPI0024746D29|nr:MULTISPECIES: ABC transporter ATP-binding protein/permease [unclassified Breznakia]MDH6366934.1 putative ABC transport system permease protein [Breznakia sp. PH1-1]MDH6404112.1 putative ABC transport system permease protein [Breznakia sp. PF1-11]MDH6411821.1 putative ABC transport system permease protein [Breznakia sp. PFB1-11]MDH6414100.1 putative ABC transport system permease protein [Breznakia sp. PFB1-14]MDH6416543.1 putative ABC transport system permease protein [Breznakia sp. PFB1-4]
MLKLKHIKKSYKTGDFQQHALKDVSLSFRKNEFVAILGQSGSGKTTMLNIIGGLDQYDSGDLVINSKSTKNFKQKDWDAYRNNCVGFIFQSYNLITHISVLSNIEMGMTLSGIDSKTRRKKAMEVLDKVGLKDHAHKKPNQLSGGQMQRVAIARALANDPDVILADEPTGALDSDTSVQIMDLITEIAKDKLVIMVTHNPELANDYANRIIELKDGLVTSDSRPVQEDSEKPSTFSIRKTAMSYLTALALSFNNIKTKKGRTLLTSFASSIGIIGIALILALSNGFQVEIDNFEKDSLSNMPIQVASQAMQMDAASFSNTSEANDRKKYTSEKSIYAQDDVMDSMIHQNKIDEDYIDYIKKMDTDLLSGISYQNTTQLNMITKQQNGTYQPIFFDMQSAWMQLPTQFKNDANQNVLTAKKETGIIDSLYDTLVGEIDMNEPGLVIQVDAYNQVSSTTLKQLGFEENEHVTFDELLHKEVKVILNDSWYNEIGDYYMSGSNYEQMYNSKQTITLKVQAIMRGKKDKELITSGSGVLYTPSLIQEVMSSNSSSAIVRVQQASETNVLTGQPFDKNPTSQNTKEATLAYLGADAIPNSIMIYPKDFESKDDVIAYLDAYNVDKATDDQVLYTDFAAMLSSLSGEIMSAITIVLIAFSAISLIVSCIMIGIITYISVLERTKEIGILRALGARKKDITRVFNAETFIIGLCSGLLGIGIAQLLTIPANIVIENVSGLANVAKLNPIHALILVCISLILTLLGGCIPAKMAAKKDPVEALRSE